MNSKVILLNIFYFIVLVSADSHEDISHEDNRECEDLKKFDYKLNCLVDGIEIYFIQEGTKPTQLYVEGYQDHPDCMKTYPSGTNEGSFTVKYDKCGIKFKKPITEYNLTVLRPPNEINGHDKTFSIRCDYSSKADKATQDLTVVKNNKIIRRPASPMNVSPSHKMSLMYDSKPVKEVEAGKVITAEICIMPKVFRAMIKKCNVSTNDNKGRRVESVTNENGCPIRPEFDPWAWNEETHCYQADFRVFTFSGRSNLKIECEVHYCIEGQCRAPKCEKLASLCPDR